MTTRAPLLLAVGLSFVTIGVACSSTEESAPTTVRPVNPDGGSVTEDGGPTTCATAPAACFPGEPQKLEDYLNACTDGECIPFDNVARLPLYDPCKPLPAVP